MKDPYVHVEKTNFGIGHAELRAAVVDITGAAPPMPKTTGTGCGRRRQLADTSKVPEKVTCLPCREWAAEQEIFMAECAESLARAGQSQLDSLAKPGQAPLTVPRLHEMAAERRAAAARYA